ncbi:MAG: DUF423 domain-containing protein [Cardiobacteriaceae bacterium]|nr:DUF423 domain-containing protein [Cardiobacteriaceae bacterium]
MINHKRIFLLIAAISGFIWVALGAMTGHNVFSDIHASYFNKAHRYQIVHTLALLTTTVFPNNVLSSWWYLTTGYLWSLGLCCFCGSLYIMAFVSSLDIRFVVPIGGIAFLLGWMMLFVTAYTTSTRNV